MSDSDITVLNPKCPDCKTTLHYNYEKGQWDCVKCGGWYKFITDESVRKQELTSLRNQLAEAQREIARLNDWEETRRRMDTSDNFLCGHKSQFSYTHDGGKTCFCMECQRDQLKQQLDEALLANKNANGQIGELSNQLTEKYAALLASELSRERMRNTAKDLELLSRPLGEFNAKHYLACDKVLAAVNEPPSSALTEALKPVRSFVDNAECKCGGFLDGGSLCGRCQALSELDKLCAK